LGLEHLQREILAAFYLRLQENKCVFVCQRRPIRPRQISKRRLNDGIEKIMSDQTIIVWDLETVPDLEAASRLFNIPEATKADARKALGSEFPKHPLHKIACIGALVAARQREGWRVDSMGAPHIGDRSEAELISTFVQRIGQLSPRLITFNGNSFDLPVLRYRAMVNRVAAAGLQVRPYFHRYLDDAVDLCDVLASYEARAKVKLDDLCKVLGISGKPKGMHGGEVEQLVDAGRIAEVAFYCEVDVLNTYRIWLIYELFRGAIEREQFDWSEAKLREFVATRKSSNPYLLDFIAGDEPKRE